MTKTPKYNSRIVFVGCVEEGKKCLEEILAAGGNVVAILTFTKAIFARTSGAVPFDDLAERYDIPLYRVKTTNSPESVALIKSLRPDALVVIGWTRLISAEVLQIPPYGCFGMHASLLPDYRGRAPVNWALIKDEKVTGNTLMRLDAGVDTGDIVDQKRIEIRLAETCKTLYDQVAQAGREMIRALVPRLEEGTYQRLVQPNKDAPSMPKRTPEDGIIDWSRSSLELFNWVRALTYPYPGAFTFLRGRKLNIWDARILHYPSHLGDAEDWRRAQPGTILSLDDGIIVSVGQAELLSLHRLNFDDEAECDWRQFVQTHDLKPAKVLVAN